MASQGTVTFPIFENTWSSDEYDPPGPHLHSPRQTKPTWPLRSTSRDYDPSRLLDQPIRCRGDAGTDSTRDETAVLADLSLEFVGVCGAFVEPAQQTAEGFERSQEKRMQANNLHGQQLEKIEQVKEHISQLVQEALQLSVLAERSRMDCKLCFSCSSGLEAKKPIDNASDTRPTLEPAVAPAENGGGDHEKRPSTEPAGRLIREETELSRSSQSPRLQERAKPRESQLSRSSQSSRERRERALETTRQQVTQFMDQATQNRIRPASTPIEKAVESNAFAVFCFVLILSNGIYIGIQTEVQLQESFIDDGSKSNFLAYDILFCVFFTVELVMRLVAHGYHLFFFGPDSAWNQFDVVNVIICNADLILSQIGIPSVGLSLLRLARLVRMLRMLRVANHFSALRTLSTMLHSLKESLSSFGPAMILIGMTVYIFGVAIMQGVVTLLNDVDTDVGDATKVNLETYFGSSALTFWTLTASISGGYDWADLVRKTIEHLGLLYQILFLVFVMFTCFCLLNILTAIFVTCARKAADMNREIATDAEIADKKVFQHQMLSLFHEGDVNADGSLTLAEFHGFLMDERSAAFLGALGLDITCIDRLFGIMDTNQSGALDLAEFVEMCTSLKGDAKILHMRLLEDDMQRMIANQQSLQDDFHGINKRLLEEDFCRTTEVSALKKAMKNIQAEIPKSTDDFHV